MGHGKLSRLLPLKGLRVVIAGDGDGAEAKARLLSGSPAEWCG